MQKQKILLQIGNLFAIELEKKFKSTYGRVISQKIRLYTKKQGHKVSSCEYLSVASSLKLIVSFPVWFPFLENIACCWRLRFWIILSKLQASISTTTEANKLICRWIRNKQLGTISENQNTIKIYEGAMLIL